MKLYRWIPEQGENLGDWLSVPILRALGHEPERPTPGEPVLFAIGSICHPKHYQNSRASRIVVWGSGAMPEIPPGVTLDMRAVRGPISRAFFDLPDDFPTGDPALLLPRLVSLPEPARRGEVLYVNHMTPPAGTLPGAVSVTAHTTGDKALALVSRIVAARFVASESLHGAIIAAAYGVPWAPCSARWGWQRIAWCAKWNDWLTYLGIEPISRYPGTLAAARAWWEGHGRHGRLRSTDALLDAFPQSLDHSGPRLRRCTRNAQELLKQDHVGQDMIMRIDDGVCVDIRTIIAVQWFTQPAAEDRYTPWVRIERADGRQEIHVPAAEAALPLAEAERAAKARADQIIARIEQALAIDRAPESAPT